MGWPVVCGHISTHINHTKVKYSTKYSYQLWNIEPSYFGSTELWKICSNFCLKDFFPILKFKVKEKNLFRRNFRFCGKESVSATKNKYFYLKKRAKFPITWSERRLWKKIKTRHIFSTSLSVSKYESLDFCVLWYFNSHFKILAGSSFKNHFVYRNSAYSYWTIYK